MFKKVHNYLTTGDRDLIILNFLLIPIILPFVLCAAVAAATRNVVNEILGKTVK